jgi:hypothetical protein
MSWLGEFVFANDWERGEGRGKKNGEQQQRVLLLLSLSLGTAPQLKFL